MVGESYAALNQTTHLPGLRYQQYSDLLPDGTISGYMGSVGTDYAGRPETLPSSTVETRTVHRAAAQADFRVVHVGFVHPYRTLPVIIISTSGHQQLQERLDAFLRRVVPSRQPDLAYVQLDTSCGRPVFARGEGVATDPRWFSTCDFTIGCPPIPDGTTQPPRTYPC